MGAAASTNPAAIAASSYSQTTIAAQGPIDIHVLYERFLQSYEDISGGRTLTQTDEAKVEHKRLLAEFVVKVVNGLLRSEDCELIDS